MYASLFVPLGSPNLPYGRKALDAALVQLYRFYRTSAVVWRCQDWEDWESMATVFRQEEQWPQVDMYASSSTYTSVISHICPNIFCFWSICAAGENRAIFL